MQVLQCKKTNFNEFRLINTPVPELYEGQIKLKIERFSFTANNITYAVVGEYLKYWSFFPAVDENGNDVSAEWGQIPVWGFATVTESKSEDVDVGQRYFGYFPPAEEVIMFPKHVQQGSFIDASEHRTELPPAYNLYRFAPNSEAQVDNERSLLYPLFLTAYCINDMLKELEWHKADQILVLSASSKTSIGVAYAIQGTVGSPACIGLTSARNQSSVRALDLYDNVVTYEEVATIDSAKNTAIIDMSGNKNLLSALHQHLGENMLHTLNVGITHWGAANEVEGVNIERSEQFFAPSHIQSMIQRSGPEGFQRESERFITAAALKTREWLNCEELDGLEALAPLFNKVCDGKIDANTGLMVVL